MDDVACPECRSNLYAQSRTGYVCLTCGFQDTVEWEEYRPAILRDDERADARRDWLEKWSWQQSKALWAKVSPKRTTRKPLTEEQRRVLNSGFMKAKKLLARYGRTHNLNDLTAAEKLADACLRYASAAARPALIHDLQRTLRAKRQAHR